MIWWVLYFRGGDGSEGRGEGEEKERKKEQQKQTQKHTEPHDKDIVIDHSVVVSMSFVYVHVCDFFVDVLLSHSVAVHHNLLLYCVVVCCCVLLW